jgi:hypothetical protein
MNQINLRTDASQVKVMSKGGSLAVFFSSALLLICVVILIGLYAYGSYLKKQMIVLDDSIRKNELMLNDEKFKKLYLFEDRLIELRSKLDNRVSQTELLSSISKKVLPEVSFRSLGLVFDAQEGFSKVSVVLNAPNHDVLSEQVKALGTIPGAENISPQDITRELSDLNTSVLKTTLSFDILPLKEEQNGGGAAVVDGIAE